jgi:multiple sugar transport system ATP-binding protein
MAAYCDYAGAEVEIGLRPEHLTDRAGATDADCQFLDGVVDVIEPMGATSLITVTLAGAVYNAIGEATRMRRAGEPLRLCAELRHMHLIDPRTERVVPPPQGNIAAAVSAQRLAV